MKRVNRLVTAAALLGTTSFGAHALAMDPYVLAKLVDYAGRYAFHEITDSSDEFFVMLMSSLVSGGTIGRIACGSRM